MTPSHLLTTTKGLSYRVELDVYGSWRTEEGKTITSDEIEALSPIMNSMDGFNKDMKEPEMFGWREAARLWADEVELEVYYGAAWVPFTWTDTGNKCAIFNENREYRRKPVEPVIYKRYYRIFGDNSIDSNTMRLERIWETTLNVVSCLEITFREGLPVEARVIGKDEA